MIFLFCVMIQVNIRPHRDPLAHPVLLVRLELLVLVKAAVVTVPGNKISSISLSRNEL